MKKWETPSLSKLELRDTNEIECSCSVVYEQAGVALINASKHPCHKTGNGEHNNNGNHGFGVDQDGHVLSVGCTNPAHYDGNNNPICCCFVPQSMS